MTERRAETSDPRELERFLNEHRVELTAYCYRVLGSTFEAEDAAQEAFLRAWKGFHTFEGRAPVRAWLYRIATNVCIDMLNEMRHRPRPIDLGSGRLVDSSLGRAPPEVNWLDPMTSRCVVGTDRDPAEVVEMREKVRLALAAALQCLPGRQRAVLILREVLRWKAMEVAELLDTTVAAVNSALFRARATLADGGAENANPVRPMDDAHKELLRSFVAAFESHDIDSLTLLVAAGDDAADPTAVPVNASRHRGSIMRTGVGAPGKPPAADA